MAEFLIIYLNNMKSKLIKKVLVIIFLIILLVIGYIFLFRWNQYLIKNKPENLCRASNGGWAPYWDLKDCDGNFIKYSSPLVVDEKTCWCHTENTCWNGKACVPINND